MRKTKIILTIAVLLSLALSATAFSASIKITASSTPKVGGTITPSGKLPVFPGADQTFVIRPVTGYEIRDVVVDKVSQGKITTYTFTNVTGNHSIKATFVQKTYAVTIITGENVKIAPSGTKFYKHGKKQKFTVTPPSQDIIPIVMVDGKKVEPFSETNPNGLEKVRGVYKFTLIVTGDHSVVATLPITPVIPETTKPLDEANLVSVSEDSITFSQPTTLIPGDVVVGDASKVAPGGLLRKVTEVNGTLVKTVQASLEDAIERGQIQVSKVLESVDISSVNILKEGVFLRTRPIQPQFELPGEFYFEFEYEFYDAVLYDLDGDESTTDDQIRGNGYISFNASFDFYVDFDNGLNKLIFANTIIEKIEVGIESGISYELEKEIPIAETTLAPVTIYLPTPIGPLPVVIVPVLTLLFGIEGGVSVGLATSISQEAQLTAGLFYNNGSWTSIGKLENAFDFEFPSFTAEASAKAYLGPRLDLKVYGTSGPYLTVNGYLDFAVDPLSNPWWELYCGLEGDVGVHLEVFGKDLADYELPGVVGWRKLIADSNTVHHQIDYSGNWRGTWSGWEDSGTLDVTISQVELGTTITGYMTPSNSVMPPNQSFLGEVDGETIRWVTANFGHCSMTATGDAVSSTHLSGTYEVVCFGELWDNGTWSLDKQP